MDKFKYCFKCGEKQSYDGIYCQKCGTRLSTNKTNKIFKVVGLWLFGAIINVIGLVLLAYILDDYTFRGAIQWSWFIGFTIIVLFACYNFYYKTEYY